MIQNILRVGKSGMSSTQNSVDLISSNITNANTTGYKKLDSEFQTLVNYSLDRDSYPNNSPDSITGVGIKSSNTYRNTAQGSLRLTEIPSNIAIDGEGYFRVLRQDGTFAYTRN
ncbi:MAG: flagellar hook-basal body complex protein, partial [Romboutsia sp.]|nr:flagellar hook-basal body complex protein [Romboutsia sp.]